MTRKSAAKWGRAGSSLRGPHQAGRGDFRRLLLCGGGGPQWLPAPGSGSEGQVGHAALPHTGVDALEATSRCSMRSMAIAPRSRARSRPPRASARRRSRWGSFPGRHQYQCGAGPRDPAPRPPHRAGRKPGDGGTEVSAVIRAAVATYPGALGGDPPHPLGPAAGGERGEPSRIAEILCRTAEAVGGRAGVHQWRAAL